MVLQATEPLVIDDARRAFSARLNEALDDIKFPAKGHGRQLALAAHMGVSQRGARKWLEGESMPEQYRAVELATWLDVGFDWLMTGRGLKRQGAEDNPSVPPNFAPTRASVESRRLGRATDLWKQVEVPANRDKALAKIRELIDGQHRASCLTDADAILLHAALKAVRGRMEPSMRAAILLLLDSQNVKN